MPPLVLVGYTYRGYEMKHALARAIELGYAGVELRDFADIDLSRPAPLARSLDAALDAAEEIGLTIPAVYYGPLPVSRDSERAEEENAFCEVIAHLAAHHVPLLHTRLSLHKRGSEEETVSAVADDFDYKAVRRTLQRITPMAESHKVRIAVEAHMGTLHDTAASLLRIVTETDSPAFTASLDFANMLIANPREPLSDTVHAFAGRIGYVHLKNVKLLPGGFDWNLPLRYGDVNYSRVLAALRDARYDGPLAVEYCGTGDPDVFADEDARYLRALLDRLEYE